MLKPGCWFQRCLFILCHFGDPFILFRCQFHLGELGDNLGVNLSLLTCLKVSKITHRCFWHITSLHPNTRLEKSTHVTRCALGASHILLAPSSGRAECSGLGGSKKIRKGCPLLSKRLNDSTWHKVCTYFSKGAPAGMGMRDWRGIQLQRLLGYCQCDRETKLENFPSGLKVAMQPRQGGIILCKAS